MTSLKLRIFNGESYNEFAGGVKSGTDVFTYRNTPLNQFSINLNAGFLAVDVQNIDFLKEQLNLYEHEYDMQQTVDYGTGVGRANTFIQDRYTCMKDMDNRLCDFILSVLHQLYWKTFNGINDDHARRTSLNLQDAFAKLKDPAYELMSVFKELVNVKYPTKLSLQSLRHDAEKHNLETNQMLNPTKSNSKSKKK